LRERVFECVCLRFIRVIDIKNACFWRTVGVCV
jgi:hypothetical protein